MFSLNSLSIFLALIVDCRGNVNCGFLCFHNAYELQSNKQCIICITVFSHSRISGPLSNGKISAFLRTSSLGIAKIVGVGFPAEFAELFVNQITGFSFGKFHALGCSFALFCTFFGGFGGCRSRYCLNLFGECGYLLLLLLDDGSVIRFGHIFRHDKSRGNIPPVTVYLHEPNRKIVSHGKQRFCVLYGISASMYGIVTSLPQHKQDIVNLLWNQSLPFQQTNPVGVRIVNSWLLDMLKSKNLKNQSFTEHTQFIQAGVGIRIHIALCCRTNLSKYGPVFFEEFKVRLHICPPKLGSASDKPILSELYTVNFTIILS